jgi:hypothetical protein
MTEQERALREELCRAEARLLRAQGEAQTMNHWWFAANGVIHGIRFALAEMKEPAPEPAP